MLHSLKRIDMNEIPETNVACDRGLSVQSCIAISLTKQGMSSRVKGARDTPPAFPPVVLGSSVLPSLFAVVFPDLVVLPP